MDPSDAIMVFLGAILALSVWATITGFGLVTLITLPVLCVLAYINTP
jgi:threonine/homoserine/homoserine lactone efflux protein